MNARRPPVRSFARNARTFDPEGTCGGTTAWNGNIAPNCADGKRCLRRQSGLFVSCFVSHATGGLAVLLLGRIGNQPPREVLFVDKSGPQAARCRDRAMGTDIPRH